jgi:hypothetical protein
MMVVRKARGEYAKGTKEGGHWDFFTKGQEKTYPSFQPFVRAADRLSDDVGIVM